MLSRISAAWVGIRCGRGLLALPLELQSFVFRPWRVAGWFNLPFSEWPDCRTVHVRLAELSCAEVSAVDRHPPARLVVQRSVRNARVEPGHELYTPKIGSWIHFGVGLSLSLPLVLNVSISRHNPCMLARRYHAAWSIRRGFPVTSYKTCWLQWSSQGFLYGLSTILWTARN